MPRRVPERVKATQSIRESLDGFINPIEESWLRCWGRNAAPTSRRKPEKREHDRSKRSRMQQEEALDDALKNTFPASDPFSIEQPTPPDDVKVTDLGGE
jgi:transcriptional regulator of acetoin/glycerol metabolism